MIERIYKTTVTIGLCAIYGALLFGMASCVADRHAANVMAEKQVQEYNRGIEEMNKIITREKQIMRASK